MPSWALPDALDNEPLETEDTSVDNLTTEEQALIDRANELGDIIEAEITQPYPVPGVSGDV